MCAAIVESSAAPSSGLAGCGKSAELGTMDVGGTGGVGREQDPK
jgi:hypothetical protein